MFSQSLNGLWNRLAKSPIYLLLFLLLLWTMLKVKLSLKNVPPNLQAAMERALTGTPYRRQLANWLAISKMETATKVNGMLTGWTSTLYRLGNNPWGMRQSTQRQHSQDGTMIRNDAGEKNAVFATYRNLDRAAQDILLYMQARKWPEQEMDLYSFVSLMKQKGYYGVSVDHYYNAVKAMLER